MHILIESHIPYVNGVAEAAGHTVEYLEPEEFTPGRVREADALMIRTRTRCNEALLAGSRVKIIATATIGTDHIDLDYCRRTGIAVHNAPGCNAPAVAQYVLSIVGRLAPDVQRLGIVGVGHVGGQVRRWAEANGIPLMLCDPPLGLPHTLADLAQACDVITFHTPLDASTRHLISDDFLSQLKPGTLVINAARGAVADTAAMLRHPELRYAIDCWEGEPNISAELLERAVVATPHIAGYSSEGKQRASAMAMRAIDPTIAMSLPPVTAAPTLAEIIRSYDPMADTAALRHAPANFESLRNNYSYRPEP